MLRSMFSAVSGLRAHQTMMDVTGNNVANVNTSGYKSSRTTFQETLAQAIRGGTGGVAGDDGQGGVNGMQLGLGSQVGGTDMVFSQGASQTTGRATDVAIQGEGFFVVDAGGEQRYTRAGAFSFDNEGQLVGPGGERVQGWMHADAAADPVGHADPLELGAIDPAVDAPDAIQVQLANFTDVAIGGDGTITGRDANGRIHEVGMLAMARFPNNGDMIREGNGLFAPGPNAGDLVLNMAGEQGLGTLQSGTLEMSNVDLAQEFTNLILSQRGFQANARSITTSDELLQELVNLKR